MVDLGFVDSLAKRNAEALSFIPRPRLEQYAAKGQILIEQENDEDAGFLVFGNGWPALRIYQACIQYDARLQQHGAALVSRAVRAAQKKGCHVVSLWCADDLPANDFWQSLGFQKTGTRDGGRRRGRIHNQWTLPVPTDQIELGL